jgi:hypothetical protein
MAGSVSGRGSVTADGSIGAPHVVANRTDPDTVAPVCALRRLRFSGPELADVLDLPSSTVSAVLKRCRKGKLGRLGLESAERYARERPGELIHIDIKKLERIEGGAGKRVTGVRRNPIRHVVTLPVSIAGSSAGENTPAMNLLT